MHCVKRVVIARMSCGDHCNGEGRQRKKGESLLGNIKESKARVKVEEMRKVGKAINHENQGSVEWDKESVAQEAGRSSV